MGANNLETLIRRRYDRPACDAVLTLGSANEVKAALDTAEAWRWLETRGPERELLDRVLALRWKLTRSQSISAAPRNRTART